MQRSQARYPAQRLGGTGHAPARRHAPLPVSRTSDTEDSGLFAKVLKSSLLGLAGFVVSGLMLVTLMCTIAYPSADPSSLITPLAMVALLCSSFLGGFITIKLTRQSPLLCGFVCGAMCAIVMLLLSLCFSGAPTSNYTFFQGLLMHGFALLFCILGSLTGNFKRKPNPRKRRFGN